MFGAARVKEEWRRSAKEKEEVGKVGENLMGKWGQNSLWIDFGFQLWYFVRDFESVVSIDPHQDSLAYPSIILSQSCM